MESSAPLGFGTGALSSVNASILTTWLEFSLFFKAPEKTIAACWDSAAGHNGHKWWIKGTCRRQRSMSA